jgi:hypothetical protein
LRRPSDAGDELARWRDVGGRFHAFFMVQPTACGQPTGLRRRRVVVAWVVRGAWCVVRGA